LIALTGNPQSTLAIQSDVHIDVSVEQEACPLNLAPTSSTTATLAMGDALAVALLESKGFTEQDFARSHPGGSLGRRLLLMVSDVMVTGHNIPQVSEQASLRDALLEMTNKGLGMTAVVDESGRIKGIYTDGDLRRTLDRDIDIRNALVSEVMTPGGTTATTDMLAAEVLKLMQEKKINSLFVVNEQQIPIGALNMHTLLLAGIF
jgi:arabinose-5-phosphate isomerase